MDKMVKIMPRKIGTWVKERNPGGLDEASELADNVWVSLDWKYDMVLNKDKALKGNDKGVNRYIGTLMRVSPKLLICTEQHPSLMHKKVISSKRKQKELMLNVMHVKRPVITNLNSHKLINWKRYNY